MELTRRLPRELGTAVFLVTALLTLPGSAAAQLLIEGKVTAGGVPAAKAEVRLIPILGRQERGEIYLAGSAHPDPVTATTTDGRGFFELTAPEIGMWAVRVDLPEHAPSEYRIQPLLDAVELPTLELDAATPLEVEVRGPDGRPVDARVLAYRFSDAGRRFGRSGPERRGDTWGLPVFLDRTGEDGRLEIPVEERGPYLVRVVAPGHLPAERELRSAEKSARFELRAGRERTVRAGDSAGEVVSGVLVWEADSLLPLTATDEDGRARVRQETEPLRLRLADARGRSGNGTLAVAEDPEAEPEELVVTLTAPPRITGRVIDRETRRPIGGALVWSSGRSGDFVSTDGNGTYELASLGENDYFWAAASGYASGNEELRQRASEKAEVRAPTLALTPAAVVSGRVVDGDGNALAGVEVVATVKQKTNPGRMLRIMRSRTEPKTARTTRRGTFRAAGLPSGFSYQLRFLLDGYAEEQQEVENLRAFEQRSDLHVVLGRGRRGVGLVIAEDDSPVPGATVRLKPRQEQEGGRFNRVILRFGDEDEGEDAGFLTDGTGRFEIPDLAAGKYDLEVEAGGFSRAAVPGIEVPEDVSEVDLGTVVMVPGVEIRGRVTDAGGRPLAAAEVRVGHDTGMPAAFLAMALARERVRGRSDAKGEFTVGDLRDGEKVHLLVSRAGFVDSTLAAVLAPTVEPLEVVMKPASRVTGKVVDEDGRPVEDAQVRVDAEGRRGLGRRTRSRADGTFEIEDVAPGRVVVTAESAGYRNYSLSGLEVHDGADLADVTLTLSPGAVIEGTVFAPDGRPVIGATVRAVEPGTTARFSFGGNMTDGDGRYWLDGMELGPRTVVAEHDVYQRVAREVEVAEGANRVDLVFEGGVDVAGRVIGPQGEPVADAVVTLVGSGQFFFLGSTQEARSLADGSFSVAGVQPGQYEVHAAKAGFAQVSATDPITVGQSPVTGLEVRLSTGATLSGEIRGLGLEELSGLRIFASNGRDFRTGSADFEGRYRITNLGVGEWRVSAERTDRGSRASGRVTVTEDDLEVELDLEFGVGYVLTGTVIVGARPMAGAWVTALRQGGSLSARATTAQDGTFRLEDLEEGTYNLSVNDASFSGLRHREEIEVTGDDDVLIELVTARINGWVTNAFDQTPVAGARVRLEPLEEGEESARVIVIGGFGNETDSRGYFSLADVTEGAWKLVAQRSGFAPHEAVVDVRGETVEELEIELTPTEGLYFEAAFDMGGSPGQVHAAVMRTPGSSDDVLVSGYGIETGEGGRVRLTEVPPGSFELLVAAPGTVTVAVPVVSPGRLGRIVLPIGGILRIRVPDLEGQPAKVRLTSPSGRPYRQLTFGGRVVTEPSVGRPIEGLEGGAWRFTATADDGRTWSGETRIVAGESVEVVLE